MESSPPESLDKAAGFHESESIAMIATARMYAGSHGVSIA